MEIGSGKVFIGGISWDTNEERLRQYFQDFGEVLEAVIMKDRATGRARGFGFVVFTDASVAEKVVRERHIINGRAVEAKKAVPRDDHQSINRTKSSIQGSPGPARTKKIFVGGLPSTATESEIKGYFDQFGTIADAVVMYDHNRQRPRGFGFITYDSEEAVDRVLYRAFHELNGKMVEVKRAVPKEPSPGPTRSPPGGYNYGMNRMNNIHNAYSYGYNASSPNGHGMRIDGCYSPLPVGRNGHPPNSPLNLNYGAIGDSGLGYGRGMTSSYHKMNAGRYGSPVGYDVGVNRNGSLLRSQDPWGNRAPSYHSNNVLAGSVNENVGLFRRTEQIWGSYPLPAQMEDFRHGKGNANSIERAGYGRNNGDSAGGLHGIDSFFSDHSWRAFSPDVKSFTTFGNRNDAVDAMPNNSLGFIGG